MVVPPESPESGELTLGLIVEEAVDLGGRTVVSADSETVISSVKDQVLAHNGQTNETEISTRNNWHRKAGQNASQAAAKVSYHSCQWQCWNAERERKESRGTRTPRCRGVGCVTAPNVSENDSANPIQELIIEFLLIYKNLNTESLEYRSPRRARRKDKGIPAMNG